MSIDINWSTFTEGEDGARLALHVRDFIHDKFQQVPLPKFIQSVQVVSFDFGSIVPDIEIKSIADPYPEFYENDDDDEDEDDEQDKQDIGRGGNSHNVTSPAPYDYADSYDSKHEHDRRRKERRQMMTEEDSVNDQQSNSTSPSTQSTVTTPFPYSNHGGNILDSSSPRRPGIAGLRSATDSPFPRGAAGGMSTPLFPFSTPTGGTSNLHYFHSALSSGFAGGTSSPLPFAPSFNNAAGNRHQRMQERLSGSPPSSTGSVSPVRQQGYSIPNRYADDDLPVTPPRAQSPVLPAPVTAASTPPRQLLREPRDDDLQVIAKVTYAGDVRMELTTQLLLDLPTRSFVSLPVRLVVTGMVFDGLACVASIGRRLHFCFLEEEQDGPTVVGPTAGLFTHVDGTNGSVVTGGKVNGGMLKEIKVESEIGEKGRGKQVLKNVGKVERFVLEQVRRIFEEEFVFPSSWTFLV